MRSDFPLFQSHLDFTKAYWQYVLQTSCCVIDATCGNGYDTLFLVNHLKNYSGSKLHVIDIQEQAIKKTEQMIQEQAGLVDFIQYHTQSHAQFPSVIAQESVALIVYNLGYLPGGCKTVTTEVSSTLLSVQSALRLMQPGGVISLTCYPGHAEGKKEEHALIEWAHTLPPKMWSVSLHQWCNRQRAPSILLIQKQMGDV